MEALTITPEDIYEQIRDLSEESLRELSRYVEILHRKEHTTNGETSQPLDIVHLEGIWEGYEFSSEDIAQARREMWKSYYDIDDKSKTI